MDGNRSGAAAVDATRVAMAGAAASAGVAVLVVALTALITFGLAESYGFGPGWDWSAFLMTAAAALLAGATLTGAIRLARLRWRLIRVFTATVVSVFAIGYVAGVLGDHFHH